MRVIPDVLGMVLNDAKALLVAEGLDFIVLETKPTKNQSVEGILRVIRVQPEDPGMIGCGCTMPQPIIPGSSGWVLTVCKI